MPLYEHIFLGRQDISSQQFEALIETYQTIIKDKGGSVEKTEYWGPKVLAYKIKKNRKAHFALLNIDAPHEAVAELERQMGLSMDVLRFLTLRVDEHETEPSAMMKRGDRDDRRGGRRDRDGPRRDRDDTRRDRARGPRSTDTDSKKAAAKTEDSEKAAAKTEDSEKPAAKTEDSEKVTAKSEDGKKAAAKTEDSEAKTPAETSDDSSVPAKGSDSKAEE